MMRQEPRQVVRTIKARVKFNAFTYSDYAFRTMVEQMIYEEDVKRTVATGRLVESREDARKITHYILQGFAMNEDEMVVVCRVLRQKIEIVDLYWP